MSYNKENDECSVAGTETSQMSTMSKVDNKVWRDIGYDTEIGKILKREYGFMNASQVKINYPKVKTKTKDQIQQERDEVDNAKSNFCPQMCKISYPQNEMVYKEPKKVLPKLAIKTKNQIDETLDQYRKDIIAKPMHFIPYEKKKEELQEHNRFSQGKTMPQKLQSSKPYNYNDVMNVKLDKKKQVDKLKNICGKEDIDKLKEIVIQEIEDRQIWFADMNKAGKSDPKLEKRVKQEIAERLNDLDKLDKLREGKKY